MDITKGTPVSVKTKFKRRGVIATFVNPPTWTLYDSKEKKLMSGVATNSGSDWIAEFTIATRYQVPNGREELTLEFSGFDSKNNSHVKTKDLMLIDDTNDLQPVGVVYSLITESSLRDSITLDVDSVDKIAWKILTPLGEVIAYGEESGPIEPKSANANGYTYKINMGKPIIPEPVVQNDPYLIVISYTVDNEEAEAEIHPLYILTTKMSILVNQLQQYLDKARLTEIDPSLQWTLPEYMHFIMEGAKHINSSLPEPSWWTAQDMPNILRMHLFAASTMYALNARYLAEGFNTFEFSGLNSNLSYDRRETLTYKIEEWRTYLESLAATKKVAISSGGTGTPPPGETDTRKGRIGALGTQFSPVSNRLNRFGRYYRRGFFGGY